MPPPLVDTMPLGRLQNTISRLMLPLDQVHMNSHPVAQTACYLRRYQTEMLRFQPQLTRGIQLLQEGRLAHLPEFIPIFQ